MTEDLTADVGLHKITFQVYPTSSRYAICSFIIAICWGAQQLIGYEGSNLIDMLRALPNQHIFLRKRVGVRSHHSQHHKTMGDSQAQAYLYHQTLELFRHIPIMIAHTDTIRH